MCRLVPLDVRGSQPEAHLLGDDPHTPDGASVTGEERLRLDRGPIDPSTGKPHNNPNAAVDHVHGYDPAGKAMMANGDKHIPTTAK
jgi:hypothetical protein